MHEAFSVRATGGTLSYRVSSDTDLLSVSPTSGTAAAAGSEITVELNCSAPETRTATITVTAGSNTQTVSVDIECERPPVTVDIERAPALAKGNPREAAESDFRWRATSSWDGQGAVPYSIRSDRSELTATPNSGDVEMDQPTETELEVSCRDQERFEAELVLEVDGVSTEVGWDVRCQAGDARMTRIQLFQGVMTWEWNERTGSVQHVRGVAGRQTAVAVAITHETSTAPDLRAQAEDAEEEVLQESLESIREETTVTGSGEWTTERVYDVGNYYLPSHRIQFFVDEDNRLDETREDNNAQWVRFGGGRQLPTLKIVFFPIRTDAGAPPAIETDDYMESVIDLLPIGRHEARVGNTLRFNNRTANTKTVLDFLHREWNRNAQAAEYYYGVFLESEEDGFCGRALIPGNVAVQHPFEDCSNTTPAHEIGHNLSLLHAPWDCLGEYNIKNTDPDYPYDEGGLGPRRGWLAGAEKFVSDESEEKHFDLMAYCSPRFISDYHYQNALEYRIEEAFAHRAETAVGSVLPGRAQEEEPSGPSLAFGGSVDEWGMWTLDYVDRSTMPARKPPVDGDYFFTLQSASGREIYRERLRLAAITHSQKGAWATRVPFPSEQVAKVIILDAQETPVLVERLR